MFLSSQNRQNETKNRTIAPKKQENVKGNDAPNVTYSETKHVMLILIIFKHKSQFTYFYY
jgi:hypothetical protein